MSKFRFWRGKYGLLLLLAGIGGWTWQECDQFTLCGPRAWSDEELALLSKLQVSELPAPPPDPSNAVADEPRAAELGKRLFFDPRLSANGAVACATCHQPARYFADGLPRARALGLSQRNTPSIVGSAYSPWQFWDGRRDSLWAQALAPLEDPDEHGGNRMALVRLLAQDPAYRQSYEALFGALPNFADGARFPPAASPLHRAEWQAAWKTMDENDRQQVNRVFANMGKVLAAYQRRLLPGPSRFDHYVAAVLKGDEAAQQDLFTAAEVRGLRLFIGEARCIECHNGPMLSNYEFHNTGLISAPAELPDRGRSEGLRLLLADPFNCKGRYSDQPPEDCLELRFVRRGKELVGAMKTPSLRNIASTAPYMHKGQLSTLREVLEHYNRGPSALIGHSESEALNLSRRQLNQLEAFLHTLSEQDLLLDDWRLPPHFDSPNQL